MTDFAWTDDRVAVLRELFAAGSHSSAEMAAVLAQRYAEAITRSAIIGKLSRMGLKRGRVSAPRSHIPRAPRKPRAERFRTAPIFIAPTPPPLPAAPAAPSTAHQCDIMGLANASCRYPVSSEPPHLFCGEPEADVRQGVPYCRFHACMCFNGKPDRRSVYRPTGETWMPLGTAARNVIAGLGVIKAGTIRREVSKEVVSKEVPSQEEGSINRSHGVGTLDGGAE